MREDRVGERVCGEIAGLVSVVYNMVVYSVPEYTKEC